MSTANTTIRIRKSLISGNVPSYLANGEIAINSVDDKLFYSKPSGVISYITNQKTFSTINANSSLVLASSSDDILSLQASNNINIDACTSSKIITFDLSSNIQVSNVTTKILYATNGVVFPDGSVQITSAEGAAFDNVARNAANSALSGITYLSDVDATQNTRLSTVEANTIYLFDALNQTNTDIVTANTNLKNYVDGAFNTLSSYVSEVDASQNSRIQSVETSVSYLSGVNDTQNTNITLATNLAQNAYDYANTIASSGIGSSVEVTNDNTSTSTKYINFSDVSTGNLSTIHTSTDKLTYVPETGTIGVNEVKISDNNLISYNFKNNLPNSSYTIDTFSTTQYRSGFYQVQLEDGEDIHILNINLTHNDSTAYVIPFGEVYSRTSFGNFSASLSSDIVNLIFNPAIEGVSVSFSRSLLTKRGAVLPGDLGYVSDAPSLTFDFGYDADSVSTYYNYGSV